MSHLTVSPGPARRAMRVGLTPGQHYGATAGTFAAFASLNGRPVSPVECRANALRVLRGQYSSACNVGDVEVARYVLRAIESGEALAVGWRP